MKNHCHDLENPKTQLLVKCWYRFVVWPNIRLVPEWQEPLPKRGLGGLGWVADFRPGIRS